MPQNSSSDTSNKGFALCMNLKSEAKGNNNAKAKKRTTRGAVNGDKCAHAKKRTTIDAAKEGNSSKKTKIAASSAPAAGDLTDGAIKISNLIFARLNEFEGKKYVDIRRFYGKDGERVPSQKGISLTLDEWKNFKGLITEIDRMVAASG